MDRRKVLAGLTGLAASATLPAWAQFGGAIKPQNDPWAQVDPYADPRNGYPTDTGGAVRAPKAKQGIFEDGTASQDPVSEADEAEEIAKGKAAFPKSCNDWGGVHPDAKLQSALRAFCRPFFEASMRSHLPWEVTMLANRTENAFAVPGGKIAVNAGLIAMCDHPGELAATVAHEVGHVDHNHWRKNNEVVQTILTAYKHGTVPSSSSVPLELLIPEAKGRVIDYMHLLSLGFGREFEFQADAHIIYIFDRLGIDPIHAVNDARKFEKKGQMNGHHLLNEMVSTHPPSAERRKRVEGLVLGRSRVKNEYIPPGWDILKAAFPTPPQFRNS